MAARTPLTLTRRGLLVGATLGSLAGCGGGDDGPRTRRLGYGTTHPDQYGDLRTPGGPAKGVVVLVHGGFWGSSYGLDLMEPLADDLVARGFATWNIEYRRLGDGGGWPTTFEDVAAAFDRVASLPGLAYRIRRGLPVLAVGHSAGGQLAAWASGRTAGTPGGQPESSPEHTFSLAGVLDLRRAALEGVGGTAVPQLLGGFPDEVPDRYRKVDPTQLDPGPTTVVIGTQDRIVPAAQGEAFLQAQRPGTVTRLDVPGDHFALIDPASAAWAAVRDELLERAVQVEGVGHA